MSRMTPTERQTLIWRLMDAFPASLANVSPGVIEAYVNATLDCSEEAIMRSIEQYSSGRVEEHVGPFAPDAGTFARNVRMWMTALDVLDNAGKQEQLITYPQGGLPPASAEALGPTKIDFGNGAIDLRGKSAAEKEEIMRTKGIPERIAADAVRPMLRRMAE